MTAVHISVVVVVRHVGDELVVIGVIGAAVARNDRREERDQPAELVVYPFVIKYNTNTHSYSRQLL